MAGHLETIDRLAAGGPLELSAAAVFVLLFFGTFVSEDAACLAAGALASAGQISFALAVTACFLGIAAGDIALYGIGRLFGTRFADSQFLSRFVSRERIVRASAWLNQRGAAVIFLSRFVTGLRLPTYLAAGFLRTDFLKFSTYLLIAAAVWTPVIVGAAAFSHAVLTGNVLLTLVVGYILVRSAIKYSEWKNRRLLIGGLKRLTNWEFWPLWLFYFPIVLYIVRLALRHRSLTVFTAANPGIPAGGFVGESKNKIYELMRDSAGRYLLRHRLISAGLQPADRLEIARRFMAENGLVLPVVVKPDKGERGKGVTIVKSDHELETVLNRISTDHILQEFFDGVEASVFYYRRPGDESGRIFSITEKRFPVLIGDGTATVEKLILNDSRAVILAKSYFAQNREKLHEIPAAGEPIRIIDIGTHSQGAIFMDGSWLKTWQLETAIDEICRSTEGFYFGRFDLRARSFDELSCGASFKIIELNGVTSESTNIYDPRYRLIDAYRILFEQWRIAFEIGAENCKLGVMPTTLSSLGKLVLSGDAGAITV
jgi:membrane protein DedA with SNARE-associated domain